MTKIIQYVILIASLYGTSYAQELKVGKKFKTIKPIYIMGQYDDITNKTISKETARAYLSSVQLAKRNFTAFREEIPVGTIITIIGLAPKPWYLYFNSDYYLVTLDPDTSRGIEVRLPLNDFFKGSLNGLRSDIFVHVD